MHDCDLVYKDEQYAPILSSKKLGLFYLLLSMIASI